MQHWAMSAAKLQKMWLDFGAEQAGQVEPVFARMADPARWTAIFHRVVRRAAHIAGRNQAKLWEDGLDLWTNVLGRYGIGPGTKQPEDAPLPRRDRRFADPRWADQPWFALLHQTYLLLAEKLTDMAANVKGLPPERQHQIQFFTRMVVDALSPANFPMTNPIVIERTLETHGENLVKGVEHMLADLRKGQLAHTDPEAFELGRNIAVTLGKVVHETPLYQLIQYSPATPDVLAVPLLIFPPWINRFYILDLNPRKASSAGR